MVISIARGEQVELPEEAAISVVTLCGLHHGVLVASDEQRPGRLAALAMVERSFDPLPVDPRVAPHYGYLVSAARSQQAPRRGCPDRRNDYHGLPLYARDRDFERMPIPELVLV